MESTREPSWQGCCKKEPRAWKLERCRMERRWKMGRERWSRLGRWSLACRPERCWSWKAQARCKKARSTRMARSRLARCWSWCRPARQATKSCWREQHMWLAWPGSKWSKGRERGQECRTRWWCRWCSRRWCWLPEWKMRTCIPEPCRPRGPSCGGSRGWRGRCPPKRTRRGQTRRAPLLRSEP